MRVSAEANGELLIVEDDKDFVDDLFSIWSPPLPVARAASGEEAVEYLQRSVPTLVLLDLNLPHYLADDDDGEGFKILSYIKSCVGSDVPVIVMTSECSQETRSHVASLGGNGFFHKPVDISDLDSAVSGAMRGQGPAA
jgi:DNA-binding response OmpR family regulator